MSLKESELSFPLERSSAMRILGIMWTGSFSGQIIVSALLLIGLLFMGNQDFNLLSISFFIGFTLPLSILIHKRVVSKGKKLMRPWCDIKFENNILYYRSGFPNTMDPNWQEVVVTNDNRDVKIKGSEVGGYHLRLSGSAVIRLGLWERWEDARENAEKLVKFTKGHISEQIIES